MLLFLMAPRFVVLIVYCSIYFDCVWPWPVVLFLTLARSSLKLSCGVFLMRPTLAAEEP